jgi:predicted glycoside hydrolase/deacetylase ChbG (UPF0249 family)
MRKLIVNADDFGFNKEITDGIILCHQQGCVTSTTLMANMLAADYAADRSKIYTNLSVGVHLNLTIGVPLSNLQHISSLIDSNGQFFNYQRFRRRLVSGKIQKKHIENEFSAQIERTMELGISPTHLDSHHNIHVFPKVFLIVVKLAKRFKIERIRTNRGFYFVDKSGSCNIKLHILGLKVNIKRLPKSLYYEGLNVATGLVGLRTPNRKIGFYKLISASFLKYDLDSWQRFLSNLPQGVNEFVAHPGLMSNDILDRPEYRKKRVEEFKLMSNAETRKICENKDIYLVNFTSI